MHKRTLQSQINSSEARDDEVSPGQRIMLAVLNDALSTFERGLCARTPIERQQFREVDRWIASDATDWPFAFENVCERLHINPQYLRDGLKRLKRKALQKAQHAGAQVLPTRVPRHMRSSRAS